MKALLSGHRHKKTARGVTLIDIIVGSALMLIVFLAISGVFRLSTTIITNSKARIGGLALAGEQLEFLRSLSYDDVGTVGGIPAGAVPQTETISLNNIDYTRRVVVQYVDDPKDGEGEDDENGVTADYKRAKVEVSWTVRGDTKELSAVTNIVPKSIETVTGGGTLIINVFDALGAPVAGANVHIQNDSLDPAVSVDIATNAAGKVIFPGSPSSSNYKITITKSGYSSAQTYDADAGNPNPNPGHLSVLEGETSVGSFQIDLLASKLVRTFEPGSDDSWEDPFDDTGLISQSASTTVSGGSVALIEDPEGYRSEGYVYSADVAPLYLANWQEIAWEDTVDAGTTTVRYRVYASDGVGGVTLIPDADLAGNAAGFSASPVDLSGLSTTTYPRIEVAGFLETNNASATPSIGSWQVSYHADASPLSNIPFHLRGAKTIGTTGGGTPIYKYDADLTTGADGTRALDNLEWDNYDLTIDPAAIGSDIAEICTPQPRSVNPGQNVTTDIYLVPRTANSLLVAVQDTSNALLSGASVRLYRSGYDETQGTSSCGQSFFGGIGKGTVGGGDAYSVDVTIPGYTSVTLTDVEVDGPSNITATLEQP